MSEKPNKGAKEIELAIKPIVGPTRTVKVDPNNKVSDLAKKVAKAFGFSKEGAPGNCKGFKLIHNIKNLASCYNEKITNLDLDYQISLVLVSAASDVFFDWDGELVKEEKEEEEEKEIVELDKKKSSLSDLDKTEKKSSWPWPRITLGVMDSGLLAAAIISSILGSHIAIPIVLIVLFVFGTIGVVRWKKLLPKRFQKRINLKTSLEEGYEFPQKNEKNENENKQMTQNQDNNSKKEDELDDH